MLRYCSEFLKQKEEQRGIEADVGHGSEELGTVTIATVVQPGAATRPYRDGATRLLTFCLAKRDGKLRGGAFDGCFPTQSR